MGKINNSGILEKENEFRTLLNTNSIYYKNDFMDENH